MILLGEVGRESRREGRNQRDGCCGEGMEEVGVSSESTYFSINLLLYVFIYLYTLSIQPLQSS